MRNRAKAWGDETAAHGGLGRVLSAQTVGGGLGWILGILLSSSSLCAHDLLAEYVHHRIKVSAVAEHLDLTLELTFFEEGSRAERVRMDADRNGRIDRTELEAYAGSLAADVGSRVRWFAGEVPMPLVPLYAPEVDLLGDDRVGRMHHRLTLRFFCRLPHALKPGVALVVEDGLWPGWPAVGVLQASDDGKKTEGILRAKALTDHLWPRLREGESRRFVVVVEPSSLLPPSGNDPQTQSSHPTPHASAP